MSEYLNFEVCNKYTGKTKIINVVSKKHLNILGYIKWYGAWRQYCFYPLDGTIWNKQCINDIIDYINNLMDERR